MAVVGTPNFREAKRGWALREMVSFDRSMNKSHMRSRRAAQEMQ
jgi:hypothetical protein